jgi:hypothetical protein
MTSPFQFIIDEAVDVLPNKRAVVASTMSRNQTVRATSRGGRIWRFTVTPSPGMRWSESRGLIEKMDKADMFTTATIDFNLAASNFVYGYQGNMSGNMTISYTQGSDTVNVTGGTGTSGFRFKSGDLLQPAGSKRVYSVVEDVPFNSTSVLLNRPIIDATGTADCIYGRACQFHVICTAMPDYKIVSYDRIEWSGVFTFVESLA